MQLFYGSLRKKNPGLSAFLATTPADEGGQPQTAMPAQPSQDPLYPSQRSSRTPYSTPAFGEQANPYPSDPLTTALVGSAQVAASGGRPALISDPTTWRPIPGYTPPPRGIPAEGGSGGGGMITPPWDPREAGHKGGPGVPGPSGTLYIDPIDPGQKSIPPIGWTEPDPIGEFTLVPRRLPTPDPAQPFSVNESRLIDENGVPGMFQWTGNMPKIGESGAGGVKGLNLLHDILLKNNPDIDPHAIRVEGSDQGMFRITADAQYRDAITWALNETSNAFGAALDTGGGGRAYGASGMLDPRDFAPIARYRYGNQVPSSLSWALR